MFVKTILAGFSSAKVEAQFHPIILPILDNF